MTGGRVLLAVLAAVAIPALALHAAAVDRHAFGLTAAPFATPRLLLAHLITAIPIGLLITIWWNARSSAPSRDELTRRLAVAALATVSALAVSRMLESSDMSFVALAIIRTLLSIA